MLGVPPREGPALEVPPREKPELEAGVPPRGCPALGIPPRGMLPRADVGVAALDDDALTPDEDEDTSAPDDECPLA